MLRRAFAGALVIALLVLIGCGPAATPTAAPTATKAATVPTATLFVPPSLSLPTPTATSLPGVTAAPRPTFTPVPAAEKPKNGGTIRVASADGVTAKHDPLNGNGFGWGNLDSVGNEWGQLIRISPVDRNTVEGDLAESWSISPDGTVWKFKMRAGVLDHEGSPYTADDAFWQMVRYIERPNGVSPSRQTCLREYIKPIWDADKKPVANGGAEVTAPGELTIRLSARKPSFVSCLTSGFTVFMPSKYIKPIDTAVGGKYRQLDFAKGEVMGTGPFKLKEFQVNNFKAYVRNDKYFRPGLPYLDGYQVFEITEKSAIVAGFEVDKLDILFMAPDSVTVADSTRIQKTMGDKVTFPKVLAMGYDGVQMNLRKAPFGPADDPKAQKIRTAVQLTIDRQEINDLAFDGVGHLSTPYYVGWDWIYSQKQWLEKFTAYDSTPAVKAKDIAKAQQLMTEAGYSATNRLKFQILAGTANPGAAMMQLVAKELSKVYMDVEVIGSTDLLPAQSNGTFDMTGIGKGVPFTDPDAYNANIFYLLKDGGFNYSGYMNPKWKALFDKQVILANDAERAPVLRDMAQVFYDDAVMIGIIRPTSLMGYRTYVKGWVPPPYHAQNYTLENVWISK